MSERFTALFVILYIGHHIGDYWVQTDRQATRKVLAGWRGHLACTMHVATYTATLLLVLLAASWRLGLPLAASPIVSGLAISALTHYLADRRAPLLRFALLCRHGGAWLDQGGGLALLDQSWHIAWLGFVAAIMA